MINMEKKKNSSYKGEEDDLFPSPDPVFDKKYLEVQ